MPSRPGLKWVIIAPTTKGWDGLIIFFNLDQMKSPAGDVSYLTKEYLRFHYDFLKISFDIFGPLVKISLHCVRYNTVNLATR